MDTTITRAEHEEFAKRIEEENHRQNRRIEILEKNMQQLAALTSSVEKLAYSIEGMVKEQESQGNRLEKLESKDGERWRSVSSYVITVIIGLVLGYIFQQAGM
jgi:TolA-binding protein